MKRHHILTYVVAAAICFSLIGFSQAYAFKDESSIFETSNQQRYDNDDGVDEDPPVIIYPAIDRPPTIIISQDEVDDGVDEDSPIISYPAVDRPPTIIISQDEVDDRVDEEEPTIIYPAVDRPSVILSAKDEDTPGLLMP